MGRGGEDYLRCGLYILAVLLLLELLAGGDGPFAVQPIVLRPGGTLKQQPTSRMASSRIGTTRRHRTRRGCRCDRWNIGN